MALRLLIGPSTAVLAGECSAANWRAGSYLLFGRNAPILNADNSVISNLKREDLEMLLS